MASATPAGAAIGTATATPSSFANTVTAQVVAVTTTTPSLAYTLGTSAQLVGPGTLKDTYAGTNTSKASGSSGSSFTTTFDLLTAAGLPAAPGTYTLDGCSLSCGFPIDSGSVTVTGAPPVPGTVSTPVVVDPGGTATITIPGTGFAKDETISIPRPGGAAADATFTENNTTSTATSLTGSLKVGSTVPAGVYDLRITDTSGQVGTCRGCLQVSGSTSGPGPVKNLTATATSATTATVSWTAPTTGTAPTSYSVVVSKTSQTTTDSGITVTVSGTSASVSGLAGSTAYFVTVTPSAGTTAGTPSVTSLQTPNPTALSLSASKASLVAGKSVTLSGVLVRAVGSNVQPLVGQTVTIAAKSDSGHVSKVADVTTRSQGAYQIKIFPRTDATYGALFAGGPGTNGVRDAPALSNAFPSVSVAPLVVAAAQRTRLGKHATVHVLGTVTPNEAGRTVRLVRIDGTGRAHTIGRATLSPGSHFSVRGNVPRTRGVYELQVRISRRLGNLAGQSATFKVHRI